MDAIALGYVVVAFCTLPVPLETVTMAAFLKMCQVNMPNTSSADT